MLSELLHRLNHEWLSQPVPEPLCTIKAAGSTGQARKVNFLVFSHGASRPIFLLKMVRERTYQDLLRNEFLRLSELNTIESIKTQIPQPLGLFYHEETLVMVETCVPGIALENLLRRGKHRSQEQSKEDLGKIKKWLINFHRSTTDETRPFKGQIEEDERVNGVGGKLSARLITEISALAADARGVSIPLTAQHGDFWAGNVLVTDNSIRIIDWETHRRAVSPFDDLFFFMLTYADVIASGREHTKRFAQAFLQGTWLAHGLASMAQEVTSSLGISPSLTSLFFLLFLFDLAGKRVEMGRMGKSNLPWIEFLMQINSVDDLVMSRRNLEPD